MNDKDKRVFRGLLQRTIFYDRTPTNRRMSICDKYNKNDLDKDVRRILKLETKLDGRGIERNIMPSNSIDIYSRLEILLGLKL